MITSKNFEFQNPSDADHLWVETLLFPIVIPEEHLYALVYLNVRPSLGVMWNQVMVCGTLTESRTDLLHYNENNYLPAPKNYKDVQSPLGLKIQALDLPRDFAIDYEHEDGTEIHVTWKGMMPPFDIRNPSHSPQAIAGPKDIHTDQDTKHYDLGGHFDMTGRITGSLTVRGRTYKVDSMERMDRSWGPRHPMQVPNVFIISASFEPDLAFHMICPWDPEKVGPEAFELTHGYVMEGDKVYGLTNDAVITAQHHGLMCTSLKMSVNDVRGKQFNLKATVDIGAPWIAGPNAMTFNSLMEWSLEGKEGYGVVMKTASLKDLNQKRGRFYDGKTTAIYV
ncbi:hypothetical protein ACIQYS_19950 [Psychrobacillus sp. NPDC096426]|uniref:DUF7065 domain-containing protein n=1 Tax=Psychrobacillus sp. NPDC096426 TaxID=3364491 RepID=UPI0038170270